MSKDFDTFDLDPHRLDEEWCRQPKMYHEQAVALADARKEHEQSKTERDLVAAEVDKDVRLHPSKYGLEKLTEEPIKKAVLMSKEYRKADTNVIEARHSMDIIQADLDTLDHRKKALENLVQLFLADYFSSPRTPKNVPQSEIDKMQQRTEKLHRREQQQ